MYVIPGHCALGRHALGFSSADLLTEEALKTGPARRPPGIRPEELARLEREITLADRVRATGVVLKRHGADLIGACPFHEDSTVSLVVSTSSNRWACRTCHEEGGVVEWEQRVAGVSLRHAVERLRQIADAAPQLQLDAEADDASLLRAVVRFYHETLLASPEGLAYLATRGLEHREAIDHFQLGLATRTLGYALPPKQHKAGKRLRERLQTLGLLRASGHEHFTGSVIVPVLGPNGEVLQVYGRKIRDDLRPGTPMRLSLPGAAQLWNGPGLQGTGDVIICQGPLDALTFWVAGYRNVTASSGPSLTAEHLAQLHALGATRVLLAHGRTPAGDDAAKVVAAQAADVGLATYRVQFPQGLDANAFALKVTDPSREVGEVIRHAVWLAAGSGETPSTLTASSATPDPAPSAIESALEVAGDELHLARGERHYRIRGFRAEQAPALRAQLLVQCGRARYLDTLDLASARARATFVAEAAQELGCEQALVKQDVGHLLLELETVADRARVGAPAEAPPASPAPADVMTDAEREAALGLLQDPQLLDRIAHDAEAAGMVGERTNVLVAYLAAVSRKLPSPLAVIVQSASAAGKTSLMDAVLAFVPPEDRVHYAALTGQALYYVGETALQHKVLSVVEEAGAERAGYALKLLQSEGELTIASTGKAPQTGKLVTHTYRVAGPVQLMLTTTSVKLDEELANRALVLSVDESPAQTRAIQVRQREGRTLEGLLARTARTELRALHQNAQRLLKPVAVVNPYARELRFQDARPRTRRDHEKYLTLIDAIALLHQHQREAKTVTHGEGTLTYIEVTPADIAAANRLLEDVLGRAFDDLPPQTRVFLSALDAWVTREAEARRIPRDDLRFSARQAREATGLGPTQAKLHLHRLVELEYVLMHRAPRGVGVWYELLTAEETVEPVRGLVEVGVGPASVGANGGSVGPRSGGGRTSRTGRKRAPRTAVRPIGSDESTGHIGGSAGAESYRT
ncbi:MAG TPA: CHC2 zinc finger domain-containing protein [bacterium]|nr:CHC2 zinc finger domain-containing protein [bacterium]